MLSMRRICVYLLAIIGLWKEGSAMQLTSPSFAHNGEIPPIHTCVGNDESPALKWKDIPVGVKSFSLVCEDPDAPHGTWDHWVLYNIPSSIMALKEGSAPLPPGCQQGLNSWDKTGYGGPCPPSGEHRYFFTLYALDVSLEFEKTPTKHVLKEAMKGHILAEATLVGRFQKPS